MLTKDFLRFYAPAPIFADGIGSAVRDGIKKRFKKTLDKELTYPSTAPILPFYS